MAVPSNTNNRAVFLITARWPAHGIMLTVKQTKKRDALFSTGVPKHLKQACIYCLYPSLRLVPGGPLGSKTNGNREQF